MTSEAVGERDSVAGYGGEIGVGPAGQQQADQFVVTCTHRRFNDTTCFVAGLRGIIWETFFMDDWVVYMCKTLGFPFLISCLLHTKVVIKLQYAISSCKIKN